MRLLPEAIRRVFSRPKPAGNETDRRLAARTTEAYRLGRIDTRTKDWQPTEISGDAAIAESHSLMHARTRDLSVNNAQVKKAVETLTDLVIGAGVQAYANPIPPGQELKAELAEFDFALESDGLFEEWAGDPEQFDLEGKRSWWDVQRLAFSENVLVGDALLLRAQRQAAGRIVPLCYQILEREQLDTSKDRPASAGQNKIVNGIELDAFNRPVAYHLFDAHPYDTSASGSATWKSRPVRADRVLHLFLFRRPSQSVGVTWLHALGQTALDRDKFIGAELQSAAKAALLALLVKRRNPNLGSLGLSDGTEDEDEYENEEIKLGSSPLAAELHTDESVEMVESQRPNPNAQNFIDLVDHDGAGAAGISFYRFTGRYEKTSYTAVRGAHLDDDGHVRPLQQWFAGRLVLPVRRAFSAQAAALGLYKTVSSAAFLADLRRYQRFDLIGAGRELLDPEGETEAALSKLRGGLTTLKIECAKRGLHWIRVLRQVALENHVADLLGVSLDHTKGQGGQTEGNTRSQRKAGESRQETKARTAADDEDAE